MELRKDYVLDRWVIINPKRGERPHQFVHKDNPAGVKKCFFCPGNENLTPMELGRVGSEKRWLITWFLNKFPAVQADGDYNVRTDNNYFTFSSSYGWHEVIVETGKHKKQLFDLPEKHLMELMKVYQQRLNEVRRKEGIKFVSLFKNHGPDAGTSIEHSHSQVIGYNIVPPVINEKLGRSLSHGRCAYCDIINIERGSFRRCFENEKFVAFTPYASRFNYEIWLFPKEHLVDFASLDEEHLRQFLDIFRKILGRLKKLGCSFNFYFQNYGQLHFHVEFCPRISLWAGFEFSTDTIINSVSPEDAASFYRGKKQ